VPASKWLTLSAEVRRLADTAPSPEVFSALPGLAFCYAAFAAGLAAPDEPPHERLSR
jgi:hypothetical protein